MQLIELSRYLLARGYEVHLISLDDDDAATFYALPTGLVWHRLGWDTTLIGKLQRIRRMRSLLRAKDIGAFVGYVMGADKTVYGAVVGTGTALIAAERNDPVIYRRAFGSLKRLLYWGLFLLCRHIVVQLPSYISGYPRILRDRIECIENFVRPGLGTGGSVAAGSGRSTCVLNVGRLHWQKGQDLLVQAFAQSGLAQDGWRLRIVGTGDAYDELLAQSEALGLQSSIEFPGQIADVATEYAHACMFVFPSRYEGFPNALAEAMSTGLPAIGFADCPGIASLIESEINGILIDGGHEARRARELASAMHRLAKDSGLRRRLGERARGDMKARSGEAVADMWDELLQRVHRERARKWSTSRRGAQAR